MGVPVIIPARNEAQNIEASLEALSHQTQRVEPLVVVNGSNDFTADIARNAGALVLESEEGKIPAIQAGLRYLGKRALEPLLILDADSKPLFAGWSTRLTATALGLPQDQPAIVWGPYYFHGEINPLLGIFYTCTSAQVSWADRHMSQPRTVRGGNMCLSIKESTVLEELLELENYWPRDDVAIFDSFMKHGSHKKVAFHPEAWVQTSGFRAAGVFQKVIKQRKHPSRIYDESYASEAPPGSKPYYSNTA